MVEAEGFGNPTPKKGAAPGEWHGPLEDETHRARRG